MKFFNLSILFIMFVFTYAHAAEECVNKNYYEQNLVSDNNELVYVSDTQVFTQNPFQNITSCFQYREKPIINRLFTKAIRLSKNKTAALFTSENFYSGADLVIVDLTNKSTEVLKLDYQWDNILETTDGRLLLTKYSYSNGIAIYNLKKRDYDFKQDTSWSPRTAASTPGKITFFNRGTILGVFNLNLNSLKTLSEEVPNQYAGEAKVLLNGKVLIIGSYDPGAYLFDPKTSTFSQGFKTKIWYNGFAITELSNNKVMLSGGQPQIGAESSMRKDTEILDLNSGSSVKGPSMLADRRNHQFIKLQDGNFLVVGGYMTYWSNEPMPPRTELFDVQNLLFRPGSFLK